MNDVLNKCIITGMTWVSECVLIKLFTFTKPNLWYMKRQIALQCSHFKKLGRFSRDTHIHFRMKMGICIGDMNMLTGWLLLYSVHCNWMYIPKLYLFGCVIFLMPVVVKYKKGDFEQLTNPLKTYTQRCEKSQLVWYALIYSSDIHRRYSGGSNGLGIWLKSGPPICSGGW